MLKKSLPFLFILATFVGILYLATLSRPLATEAVREGGPVENATVVILWSGAVVCLWRYVSLRTEKVFWIEFTILLLAMAIRESDPHRLVPGFNFLKPSFYGDTRIPVYLRLLFGISLTALCGLLTHLGFKIFFLFWDAFRKNLSWTFTAMAFLAAECAAAINHKLLGAFLRLFMDVSRAELGFFATVLEEPLELAASVLLVVTVLQIPPLKKI